VCTEHVYYEPRGSLPLQICNRKEHKYMKILTNLSQFLDVWKVTTHSECAEVKPNHISQLILGELLTVIDICMTTYYFKRNYLWRWQVWR